ncbi:MAG: Rieske (2Fe-2S) protein [Rhodospirillaceae bacterium]|nr:MAG: Rieske (2Fe-2S) protein [Rhodospirillaceae bacterium]
MSQMDIANATDIVEGKARAFAAGKLSLVLTRLKGKVYAFQNKCPHLGLPLVRGQIDGTTIRCPWHGARFDICSGENLEWCNGIPGGITMPDWTHKVIALGKKPAPLHSFETREENGRVYVTMSES